VSTTCPEQCLPEVVPITHSPIVIRLDADKHAAVWHCLQAQQQSLQAIDIAEASVQLLNDPRPPQAIRGIIAYVDTDRTHTNIQLRLKSATEQSQLFRVFIDRPALLVGLVKDATVEIHQPDIRTYNNSTSGARDTVYWLCKNESSITVTRLIDTASPFDDLLCQLRYPIPMPAAGSTLQHQLLAHAVQLEQEHQRQLHSPITLLATIIKVNSISIGYKGYGQTRSLAASNDVLLTLASIVGARARKTVTAAAIATNV
jgi:hypothetical protein